MEGMMTKRERLRKLSYFLIGSAPRGSLLDEGSRSSALRVLVLNRMEEFLQQKEETRASLLLEVPLSSTAKISRAGTMAGADRSQHLQSPRLSAPDGSHDVLRYLTNKDTEKS